MCYEESGHSLESIHHASASILRQELANLGWKPSTSVFTSLFLVVNMVLVDDG